MAEPQLWSKPQAESNLDESRAKPPARRLPDWLWAWWPALMWAGVIFTMSTDTFSSEHTATILERILRWFWSSLTASQFETIHFFIRKSAHFTEYFIFCVLLYRAVRGRSSGWRWTWGLIAFLIAAGYSASDEFHQSFVPSRGASAYDSLLDSTGALVALAVLWLWFRLRQKAKQHVPR